MTPEQITQDLEAIAAEDNFEFQSYELVKKWDARGIGEEVVEPVLRFMESHPDIDYGPPGPLVLLIEKPWKEEGDTRNWYCDLVVESIERKPTAHTAWLLNRIINVEKDPGERSRLLDVMKRATRNANADSLAIEELKEFLKYQASKQP